jgi:hypothetical protein
MQELLNLSARLGNEKWAVDQKIKELRGDTPPACWGEDDCSTMMLMVCPWRIDCGECK